MLNLGLKLELSLELMNENQAKQIIDLLRSIKASLKFLVGFIVGTGAYWAVQYWFYKSQISQ